MKAFAEMNVKIFTGGKNNRQTAEKSWGFHLIALNSSEVSDAFLSLAFITSFCIILGLHNKLTQLMIGKSMANEQRANPATEKATTVSTWQAISQLSQIPWYFTVILIEQILLKWIYDPVLEHLFTYLIIRLFRIFLTAHLYVYMMN